MNDVSVSPSEISNLPFIDATELDSVFRIGGGKNNRVYRVVLKSGVKRVVKIYFSHPHDSRDRLAAEFNSLTFLWKCGIRAVAEPLDSDKATNSALYSFIEGEKRTPSSIEVSDIRSAIKFAKKLYEIRTVPGAEKLGVASEACFSIEALESSIERRLHRVKSAKNNPAQQELELFLPEITSFFSEVHSWCLTNLKDSVLTLQYELKAEERTLSPSDFGFHNGLVDREGIWKFLDFEYFGWDDPAKLVADFILHPGMALSLDLQRQVVRELTPVFSDQSLFKVRLQLVYPLYAIKWCAILLNEFVPEFLERRGFADLKREDLYERQMVQLTKARVLTDNVRGHFQSFFDYFTK